MREMRQARTPPSDCLSCGYRMDAAGPAYERDATPRPGDITMCLACGHLMAFERGMTLRDLTPEEQADAQTDPRILKLLEVHRRMKRQMGKRWPRGRR
jgi:hypothetical protein